MIKTAKFVKFAKTIPTTLPYTGPDHLSSAAGMTSLSESVTHARFVGTNPASDEVVLMKILQVGSSLLTL